jgi:ubiquinone/menaquinone biosynthesis C-methylase UbiE
MQLRMAHPSTDSTYLAYQYDDSDKLRIRIETHAKYSVGTDDFAATELRHLGLAAGHIVLDAGCGPGTLAERIPSSSMTIVGIDRSFGMLREASATSRSWLTQADVVALPFRDAAFDRVASLGVLYHVGEWLAALREMRRVCRPGGGRIVVSTNGRHTMQRLLDLHSEAARELRYVPREPTADTLRLEDLNSVRAVLPTAKAHVLESALVFPTAEPALRFYATNRIDLIQDRPADASHRPQLLAAVGRKIDAIIAREGTFSVPKTFGYFVADL